MGMGMDKDAAIPGEEYDFIPTFDIVLDPSKKKRIFAMTTEILAKGGGRREGERITEAIGRMLRSASDKT